MIKIKRYYLLIILFLAQSFASTNNYMYNDLEKSKINLIYYDLYTTDLSFILENYQIIPINANNNKYKVIIDYGTPILDFGKPDLPKFSTYIIMKIELFNLFFSISTYLSYKIVDLTCIQQTFFQFLVTLSRLSQFHKGT